MDVTTLAQQMKEFIETELGLYVEVRHNGKGYSFYPITTTGRVIGETRLIVNQSKIPVVFVNNRGYFSGLEGMALATRFRNKINITKPKVNELPVLDLTEDMRVDLGELLDFPHFETMAESSS